MTKRRSAHAPAKSTTGQPTVNNGNGRLQQELIAQTHHYSGPIPPPDALREYNQILPDAAERIMAMAEANAAHERALSHAALDAQIAFNASRHKEVVLGQVCGMGAVVLSFGLAAYAMFSGYSVVATTICSVTVVGLVSVFIAGRVLPAPKKRGEG